MAPYATSVISVQGIIETADSAHPMGLPSRQYALNAEKYIESDEASIKQVAESLKDKTVVGTAKKIFEWTSKHVKSVGYVRENRGALYALKEGKGDCTEFSYLFVALCRSLGIPARPMGGFFLGERGKFHVSNYHNWAEFYDGSAWQIADPLFKNFSSNQKYYVAFRILRADEGDFGDTSQRFLSFDDRLEVALD